MSPFIDIPDKCTRMMVFVSGLGYLLLSSLNPKSAPEQEISFHTTLVGALLLQDPLHFTPNTQIPVVAAIFLSSQTKPTQETLLQLDLSSPRPNWNNHHCDRKGVPLPAQPPQNSEMKQRWFLTTDISSPVCLARELPSFFTSVMALLCSPLNNRLRYILHIVLS